MNVSRRLARPSSLAVLALLLGLPGLAQAQLFPNLPIRRQRVDCAHENPAYPMIRQQYWGYYPTCWRRFPPGWGCPSAEAPNWAASLEKQPLPKPENTGPDNEEDEMGGPQPGANPPGGRPGTGERPARRPAAAARRHFAVREPAPAARRRRESPGRRGPARRHAPGRHPAHGLRPAPTDPEPGRRPVWRDPPLEPPPIWCGG